jgi:hypothetical protein
LFFLFYGFYILGESKATRNTGRMTLPKESSNSPVTDSKEMKIYELPER